MILGVGTDIVSVSRVARLSQRYGCRFCERILHPEDYRWILWRSPSRDLAKCFSAKEALSKALGSGIRYPLVWRHIGIARDSCGKPFFVFDPVLQDRLSSYRIHLSLSDEQLMVLAFVVVEKVTTDS